jgi:hypothetical protein
MINVCLLVEILFDGGVVMNTIIKAIGLTGILGLSTGASALNVGGVIWNPNDEPLDFSMKFDFTQWYTSSTDAIGSGVNLAPSYAAALSVPSELVNGDSVLTGVGEVYSINGEFPVVFCPGCELTTVFGGIKLLDIATQSYDLTEAFINIYVDHDLTEDYPGPGDANNQGDVNEAANGDLWLSLGFDTLSLTGSVTAGFVESFQSVTGGMAAPYFVSDTILEPISGSFYDAQYIGSANFLTDDHYSVDGNGSFSSETIPEPSAIALLGFGLLGLSYRAMRKKTV